MKMMSRACAVPDIDELIFMLSDGNCGSVSVYQLLRSNHSCSIYLIYSCMLLFQSEVVRPSAVRAMFASRACR